MQIDPGTVIVSPSSFEFNAVRKGLNRLLNRGNICLMMCGVGENMAEAFCAKLETAKVSRLVLVGWGGGLTARLKSGDLLCADIALHDGLPPIACTPSPHGKLPIGPILTSSNALFTPAEKQAAANTGALAVEMEAYPLAAWANQHFIPFIHGRVILDAWDETLPILPMNDSGKIRSLELLEGAAKRPAMLGDMARLGRRVLMLGPLLAKLALDLIED